MNQARPEASKIPLNFFNVLYKLQGSFNKIIETNKFSNHYLDPRARVWLVMSFRWTGSSAAIASLVNVLIRQTLLDTCMLTP